MILAVALCIVGAVLFVVLMLASRLFSGLVKYALFNRHKNSHLKIPHAGVFAMLSQVKPGGMLRMIQSFRTGAPSKTTFAPLVFAGSSRDGRQIVVACSADAVKEVLTDTETFEKSPDVYKNLGPMLGQGLATSEGDVWFQQRKRLTPMFHLQNLRSYTPLINDEGRLLCEKLASIADGGKAQISHVPKIFAHTALNVIARAVFGDGQRLDIERVGKLWSDATDAMGAFFLSLILFPKPLVPYLPNKKVQTFLSSCHQLDELFSQVIDECRANPHVQDGSFDLVAQMALLKEESNSDWAIPKQLIIDECKTFTFAAQDTTSNLLSFAMFFLGQDKKIQNELIQECAEVLGDAEGDVIDCDKLKLHRAVLTECLRLRPPVPTLSRLATRDATLCGQRIEAGTTVVAAMIAPQTSSDYFEDPLDFKPHRWIDGSTKDRHPFAFTAFSAGSRSCIGQKLAMNEATVLLSHIIRRFEVTVDNPDEVVVAFRGTAEPLGMKVRFLDRRA